MSGTLNVVAADAKVPSQAEVDQQVAKQVSKDLKGAWQADKKANHDAISQNKDGSRTLHVTAGTSSKDGKVALLEFFPRNLDAKPGDTVVFTPRSPNEPHTVTFPMRLRDGHDQPLRERIVGHAVRATRFLLSRQPRSRARRDRVRWRQRCLAGDPAGSRRRPCPIRARSAPPREARSFGIRQSDRPQHLDDLAGWRGAGTYTYVCQIHDGMDATITVH